MLEDGGQLFSYFVQERQAKMLYLYASKFDEDRLSYKQNMSILLSY